MQFRVLGPLEVDAGDGPIPLGGPKQRAVLANLLVRANEVVPTDVLIAELWGEETPDGARNTLQTYVSNLRRALGNGRLRGRSPGYVLMVDPPELDAARFDALVREAKRVLPTDPDTAVQTLEDALALWRGPALADLSDQSSLLAEATRLDELRLEAEADRIEGLLASGAHAKATAELEALVVRHPLRERLWGLLMLALYREGRQAEALGAFQRAREILAEELGIDPSPELARLQQRILEHDPGLDLRGEPLRGYRLLERLGEGSSGVVHRAIQPHVGREVAVKSINPDLASDPDFVRRFEAEAQLVARLEHPHIVPLYDYWRDPEGAYLVMRYLVGGSLRRRLDEGETFAPAEMARLLENLCQALATAHRQGIVHRDVKPENVLLDEDGNAYLTDFGIAKDISDPRATRTGPLGTPAYLAPEQVKGERVSPQTDVYGLGVLLFEALTGEHPFGGGSIASLLERVLHEPLPSALAARPELPPAVDEVIARATAKEPALRYPDALSFATAFGAALDPAAVRVAAADAPNPFKGLRSFAEADAAEFFGREALVERLVARLAEPGEQSRFLGVVGPSGSGKSSAVRAGLVPALRGGALEGSVGWFYVEMAPGGHPFDELEGALLRVAVESPALLGPILADDERGLSDAVDAVLPDDGARLVLVVDQLEEAFTLVQDEGERRRFLDRLASVVGDPRVTIVATLRADFYDRPLAYPGFGELLAARTEAVPALTADELEQAIRAPAEQVGVHPEPGLVAEVVADVAHQPGALPLVQYALTELFERRADGRLTLEAYREIGGIAGALSARAERIYAEADDEGRHAIRQVFLRLVTLGEGREDTRRLVTRSELDALQSDVSSIDRVLQAFGRHRLLTFDREPATREPTVEIAHEALLGAWDRLGRWIDGAREDLRQERRLAHAAAEWRSAERDPSFLLRGARLEQVEAWSSRTDLAIGHPELEFVKASVDRRDAELTEEEARRAREEQLERRSVRRLRGLVALFAVAALIAGSLTLVATGQSQRAEREARIATARELANAATASIPEDPERAVLLAIASVRTTRSVDGSVLPEAEDALHRAIAASRVVMTIPEVGGPVAWGSGVFATEDPLRPGTIQLRDGETGSIVRTIAAHDGSVTELSFASDGGLLASTGSDGVLAAWDPVSGELVASARGSGEAMGISSAGGLVAATWPHEKVVRVLDAGSGNVIRTFEDTPAQRTALSPEAGSIALSTYETIVRSLATGKVEVGPLEQAFGAGSVAWSPDGRYLATSGLSGPDVWDASTGELLFHLPGQPWVDFLAWSADPMRLVTGGIEAQNVKVWEIAPSGPGEPLTLSARETSGGVDAVAISPDSSRVVATALDGTAAKVWDVSPAGDAEWVTIPTVTSFGDMAFTPDGRGLVAADAAGHIRVWDPVSGEPAGPAIGPRVEEHSFDLSPDGRSLVLNGTIAVYDTSTGRAIAPNLDSGSGDANFGPGGELLVVNDQVQGHGTRIVDLTGRTLAILPDREGYTTWRGEIGPDGRTVATIGEQDGSESLITIWDWRTEEVLRTIPTAHAQGLTFDPTGDRLATSWGAVSIWDVRTGAEVTTIEGGGGGVAFGPDGSRLAVAGRNGVIRLFDTEYGTQLLAFPGDPAFPVGRIALSPDGSKLASQGPSSGVVRVWALDIDDLLQIAERNVTRSLTDAECRQYLHLEACPT